MTSELSNVRIILQGNLRPAYLGYHQRIAGFEAAIAVSASITKRTPSTPTLAYLATVSGVGRCFLRAMKMRGVTKSLLSNLDFLDYICYDIKE